MIYEGKKQELSINMEIFASYLVQTCIFPEKPSEISQMCFRLTYIILHKDIQRNIKTNRTKSVFYLFFFFPVLSLSPDQLGEIPL